MTQLRLLPAPEDRSEGGPVEAEVVDASGSADGAVAGQRFAPGAPPSPGPVPMALARHLRMGEPTVWWGEKHRIERGPMLWLAGAGLFVLLFATLLAPELWDQPLADLWKPLVPALAPALLYAVRQYLSLRAVLVTDSSVIVRDFRGRVERLAFRNVRRVRRDFVTGGILLEGATHRVRLPPDLADDARDAIGSQTRHTLRSDDGPDDPIGWLP